MIVPAESPLSAAYCHDEAPRFPVYRPTAPQDRRRGRHADRAAMARLSPEVQARVAEEDEALLAAEAQLPGGEDEIHWSELESDSSEDDEYFFEFACVYPVLSFSLSRYLCLCCHQSPKRGRL